MSRLEDLADVLTIHETATILRISVNGCYEAARRGEIPTIRIGRRLLVPKAALANMLARAQDERALAGIPPH